MYEKATIHNKNKQADIISGAIADLLLKENDSILFSTNVILFSNFVNDFCYVIIYNNGNEDIIKSKIKDIRNVVNKITGMEVITTFDIINLYDEKESAYGIYHATPVNEEQIILNASYDILHENNSATTSFIIKDTQIYPQKLKELYWLIFGVNNRMYKSDCGCELTINNIHGSGYSLSFCIGLYVWLKAQETGEEVCILYNGENSILGKSLTELKDIAKNYVELNGGFEQIAKCGFINKNFIASKGV